MQNNLTREWLNNELKKKISDVFYAAINTNKVLYISMNDSRLQNIQEVED